MRTSGPARKEADRGECGEGVEGGIEDTARQHPRSRLILPFEEACEDRDEGRTERAGGDDEEEEVRDAEGGVVGIEVRPRAELPRDDHIAQQAKHAVGDEGEPHHGDRPPHRHTRAGCDRSRLRQSLANCHGRWRAWRHDEAVARRSA